MPRSLRRPVRRLLAGGALATLLSATSAGAQTVETLSGPVTGATSAGVTSFKGIAYAAPPTGPNRWRAPQPAAPW
ncbi:carboxylesterase family protein, partial [Novosphingobium sp. 1949]